MTRRTWRWTTTAVAIVIVAGLAISGCMSSGDGMMKNDGMMKSDGMMKKDDKAMEKK
jgi:hypothetical protein